MSLGASSFDVLLIADDRLEDAITWESGRLTDMLNMQTGRMSVIVGGWY